MRAFRKAILIIHGYAGGTYDQEPLANYLQLDWRLDVYTFTLPGHDVKDRKKGTSKLWISESEKQIERLISSGYKDIYLIGHSMGGVIATYLATKYKEVKRLVLAAPAFTCVACKDEGGFLNVLKKGSEIIKTYDWNEFSTRFNKMPLSSTKEFFKLIEEYRDLIYKVNIPILIIHGTKDNIVPLSMSENIYEKLKIKKKQLIEFDGSYHDLFKGKKSFEAMYEVKKFLLQKKIFMKESKKKI